MSEKKPPGSPVKSNAAKNTRQIWAHISIHRKLALDAKKNGRTIRKTFELMALESLGFESCEALNESVLKESGFSTFEELDAYLAAA